MLTANNMSAALYTIIITWTLWEIGIMIVSGIAAIAKKEEFKMDNTLPTVKFDGWYFFSQNLKGGMYLDEKEIYEICQSVDAFIADYLAESIVKGTSYDLMEAHHGILPISRNCFYRRRRIVQRIMKQRLGRIEEENGGQLRVVWD
jgi:hypothetical protein